MRWIFVALCVSACGRIDFDPATDGAQLDTGACTLGSFGAPTPLNTLESATNDWAPWLAPDGLEIVFASDRPGGPGNYDLYRATRASTAVDFDPPQMISEVSSSDDDDDPFLSDDGLTMWFSGPGPAATHAILTTTRAARGAPFVAPPQPLAELELGTDVRSPDLSEDLRTILFNDDAAGGTGFYDLYEATRAQPTGPFSGVIELVALNSPDYDCCAAFGPAGEVLYVSNGLDGSGHFRIMHADSLTGVPTVFGPTAPSDPTTTDDWDPFWSNDGTTIVFGSSRAGGMGGVDLYMITRTCM